VRWAISAKGQSPLHLVDVTDVADESTKNWSMMEQDFRIEDHVDGEIPIITVFGEIDVATAPQLRDCLHRVIAQSHATVVVDLLAVTFLDSTALGVLVGALKRCREFGGELHVVVTDPRIIKIFEITGLTKVFRISDSLTAVSAS